MNTKKLCLMTVAAIGCANAFAIGRCIISKANDGAPGTTMATIAPLNLREGPGTNYNSKVVMPAGSSVEVLKSSNNGWYYVRYNGMEGYAYHEYLNFEGPGGGTFNDGRQSYMYTNAPLNVRSNPSTSAAILGSFACGAKVPVIGRVDGWYKVNYQGNEGYCYGEYLDFGGGYSPAPAGGFVATAPLNIRSQPSTNASILGSFAEGEQVAVIRREGDWYKVNYRGNEAYCYGEYLRQI